MVLAALRLALASLYAEKVDDAASGGHRTPRSQHVRLLAMRSREQECRCLKTAHSPLARTPLQKSIPSNTPNHSPSKSLNHKEIAKIKRPARSWHLSCL